MFVCSLEFCMYEFCMYFFICLCVSQQCSPSNLMRKWVQFALLTFFLVSIFFLSLFYVCMLFEFFCLFVFVIWFCVHGKNHASLKRYPLFNSNNHHGTAALLLQIWLMQLYGIPYKTAVAKATLDCTLILYYFASRKEWSIIHYVHFC